MASTKFAYSPHTSVAPLLVKYTKLMGCTSVVILRNIPTQASGKTLTNGTPPFHTIFPHLSRKQSQDWMHDSDQEADFYEYFNHLWPRSSFRLGWTNPINCRYSLPLPYCSGKGACCGVLPACAPWALLTIKLLCSSTHAFFIFLILWKSLFQLHTNRLSLSNQPIEIWFSHQSLLPSIPRV